MLRMLGTFIPNELLENFRKTQVSIFKYDRLDVIICYGDAHIDSKLSELCICGQYLTGRAVRWAELDGTNVI
jgi:hypothetical protein